LRAHIGNSGTWWRKTSSKQRAAAGMPCLQRRVFNDNGEHSGWRFGVRRRDNKRGRRAGANNIGLSWPQTADVAGDRTRARLAPLFSRYANLARCSGSNAGIGARRHSRLAAR